MRTTPTKKRAKIKIVKPVKLEKKTLMLRIDDQETLTNLEALQKAFMCSQSSKAIVKAINEFHKVRKELDELKQFSNRMTQDYWDLRHAVEAKINSENEIAELLKNGSKKRDRDDDDDDDDDDPEDWS